MVSTIIENALLIMYHHSHSKADCTKPRQFSGECYNCGEEGYVTDSGYKSQVNISHTSNSHSKADCPKPRVFKGTCRLCGQEGHPKALCPDKPVDVCHNCKGLGKPPPVTQPFCERLRADFD